jgi:hypothetical protein
VRQNTDNVKDWRSTGRKRGRKILYESYRTFVCVGWTDSDNVYHACGKTTAQPPPDAPSWFEEIWPEDNRVLQASLQVDHENKDYTDNDPANLEWRCNSCHRFADNLTEKGVSRIADQSGYF